MKGWMDDRKERTDERTDETGENHYLRHTSDAGWYNHVYPCKALFYCIKVEFKGGYKIM